MNIKIKHIFISLLFFPLSVLFGVIGMAVIDLFYWTANFAMPEVYQGFDGSKVFVRPIFSTLLGAQFSAEIIKKISKGVYSNYLVFLPLIILIVIGLVGLIMGSNSINNFALIFSGIYYWLHLKKICSAKL